MTPTLPVSDPELQAAPDPTTEPEFGERNRELPEQLKKLLEAAIKKSQNEEKYLRRLEVLHDRRNRYYERGHQHIYQGRDGCYAMAVAGASFTAGDGSAEEWGTYIDDYNIFHGFEWIIVAVMTQSPTGVAFEPIDPSKAEDCQAAETAEGIRKFFNRMNDIRAIEREKVRMMCLSGRFAMWTRTVENPAKWGRNPDGSPKKAQICTVYGALETKCPIMERTLDTMPYFIVYDDLDVRNAKAEYSWIKKRIKANENCLDENNYERFARLGVLQGAKSQFQAGESIAHMVTRGNCWLRPCCFEGEDFEKPYTEGTDADVMPDGSPMTCAEKLQSMFPDGVHVVYVGQTYAESWAESMDDCLQAATPFPGDGQHAIAVLDPIVVVQDKFNDQMNYIAEVFDYGAPSTFVNADNNEYAAIVNQRAEPYSFRQLKAPNGTAMSQLFYREPNPEVPATMQPYLEFLMGPLPQFMTATPPAVWGESTPDTKTASGLAQSRNQALGRLGIIWSVLQWTDARMYYQAALAAANDPSTPESITVPVKEGSNVVIRVERLRKGHFMAIADDDSGFPESTQALRGIFTQVMQLAGQFPPLAAQLFNPENLQTMLRTYGLTELVIPEAQSGQKQMEEIEILLEGVPVDPTPEEIAAEQQKFSMMSQVAAQMGAPPPPPFDPQSLVRSSVPIQPWDHDDYEAEKCQDWLNSDACRVELQVGRPDPVTGVMTPNLRGVANVEAHRQEHLKALAAKMPPPMPGGAPDAVSGGTGTPPKPKAMTLPTSAPVGTPGTIAQ